jgi:predicted transcriptional regulator
MSIIKKAPAILTREFRMEEPVSALLDEYAQFIESSPDHVINSALRKMLWRDQDYRKWREQRKDAGTDAAKRGAAEGPAKP